MKRLQPAGLPVVRALVAALGLALAAFMLIDWNALVWSSGSRSTDDAQLRGEPAALQSRVSGLIAAERDIDNRPVHRGDLLFRIEDDYARAALAQAQARLGIAEAAVARARAEQAAQQARIEAARAEAAVTDAQRAYAVQDAARWDRLAGTPGDVLRSRQQADTSLQAARQTADADERAVAMALAQQGAMQAATDQAEQQRRASEQAVRLAAIDLDHTRIMAPADGRVTERVVHVGQWVEPGRRLISFVALPGTWAVAWYREEQVPGMQVGQPVDIHVDAYPELRLQGCIAGFSPTSQSWSEVAPPNRATGNFTKVVQRVAVRITYRTPPDAVPLLVPGLSVETRVRLHGAPCSPAEAH